MTGPHHKPRVALATMPGLESYFFTDAQLARLHDIADVLDETALDDFSTPRAAEVLARAEVVLGHWYCPVLDAEAVARAPELRLLAYAGGTVKWIVSPALFDRGVVVTSAAAANAVPVAEYTLAAILLANKGAFASREWYRDQSLRTKRPDPVGNVAKRVGLVGASNIGRLVIELLAPFELTVAVYDPYLTEADAARLGVEKVDLDELMADSDVVSLHAPDIPATKGMIGASQLALLADGVTLVNTARGALIDQAALEAELATGRISAVLDVTEPEPPAPDSPLLRLPNVFLTPHIAGAQGTEVARLADLAIDEIERFAAGAGPRHPVTAADLERIA